MEPKIHKFGPGAYESVTLTETGNDLQIDGLFDLFCGEGATHRVPFVGFQEEKYVVEDGEMYETYMGTKAERWAAQMVEFVLEDANYYDPCQPHSDEAGECSDGCDDPYHSKEFAFPPK